MMKKLINGYEIINEFSTAGGGMCRWSFAKKNGYEFFIKEFLYPKYPVEGSPGSEKTKEMRRAACISFEKQQNQLISSLKSATAPGGNLVAPIDFFRDGALYYKVTEKVDVTTITPKELSTLPIESKLLLLKTIAHSLTTLHRLGIVHGDLKPENILIKKKGDKFIAKLIDMDNSYFSGKAPEISENSDIVGTPNYYSPELGLYIKSRGKKHSDELTTKSDIFALGVIFSQYLTGSAPIFNHPHSRYVWEAIHNKSPIVIPTKGLPEDLHSLITQMLNEDYRKRPSCQDVFNKLKSIKPELKTIHPIKHSRLKGTLLRK